MHHLGARALARVLSIQTTALQELDFRWFLKYGRAEERFPRAQPRARPCSARQRIFLTIYMLFDYLVAILASKLKNLDKFKVTSNVVFFSEKKRIPALIAAIL